MHVIHPECQIEDQFIRIGHIYSSAAEISPIQSKLTNIIDPQLKTLVHSEMNWFLYKIFDSEGLDTLFILETLAYAKERAVLMRVWDMVRKKREKNRKY